MAYSVDSFFFAYSILEIPFEIISSLLFSLLIIAVNLERSVSMLFVITLVSFCMVNCGEALGIIFNTLILDSTGFALNLTSSLMSIAGITAGEHFPVFFFRFRVSEVGISRYLIYRYACVLRWSELHLSEQIRCRCRVGQGVYGHGIHMHGHTEAS
jgi:hypothetical protein